MSDLKKYIKKRKNRDKAFAHKYDEGHANFKIGMVLRGASKKLKTKKTAILKRKIPEFKSEKEEADFFSTHSPLDYPDEFE
jgi:hypothetical protein